jgi:hypothetical protein
MSVEKVGCRMSMRSNKKRCSEKKEEKEKGKEKTKKKEKKTLTKYYSI